MHLRPKFLIQKFNKKTDLDNFMIFQFIQQKAMILMMISQNKNLIIQVDQISGNYNKSNIMRFSNWVVTLAILISAATPALIYIPNVQIDPILIYQVQVACDRLQASLRATYGTMSQNDIDYYVKTYAANWFLKKLSNAPALRPYSNVVVGSNNTVTGAHSLIIGNDNMVLGNGNYVFSQNFNSAAAGATGNNLVLDEWLIKLVMLEDINSYIAYSNNPKSYIYRW